MTHKIAVLLLIITSLCSCNKTSTSTEAYFLAEQFTEQGIINKYYVTNYPKSQRNIKTGLEYIYIKKLNDSLYAQDAYNPAFKLESSKQFILKDKHLIITNYSIFFTRDTLNLVNLDKKAVTYTSFDRDTVNSIYKLQNSDSISFLIEKSFKFVKDTIIESKPAIILEKHITRTKFYGNKPKDTTGFHIRTMYVQNIGLWKSTTTTDTAIIETILVEQLAPKHYDSLSNHTIQRVGYIDFDKTIDADYKLELCSSQDLMADYYSSRTKEGGFIGGKGNLKKFIDKKLNTNKLNNESGYLTFRFVVNCKGQAGKFVTNQADFEYNEKQFSKTTIMHLYDIISSVEKWDPRVTENVKRDSYFYVTFILKNGKIEDILP